MESGVQSMAPFIGVISQLIGWIFFLIALAMFKGFLSKGFSIAVSEFMLKTATDEQITKICRWFGNSEDIITHLDEIKKMIESDGPESI